MSKQIDRILADALVHGVLDSALTHPAAQPQPASSERHWSLLVFTGLGAWLCAIPLLGVVLLASYSLLRDSGGVVLGIPLLVTAVIVLRSTQMTLFQEQLAFPALLVGAGLLAFQIEDKTHSFELAVGLMGMLALLVAALVPRIWLRILMGAGSAVSLAVFLEHQLAHFFDQKWSQSWLLVAGVWLVLHVVQRRIVLGASTAAAIAGLEALSSGLAVAALAGMTWASGSTFLVGEALGHLGGDTLSGTEGHWLGTLSSVLALAGGILLVRRWPVMRSWWYPVLVLFCALLAWFAPLLGAVLLMLCACASSGRHGLAAFAGVAAVWMIGGLYYVTAWPLAAKALLLLGVGIAAGCIGRYAIHAPLAALPLAPDALSRPATRAAPVQADRRLRLGVLLCGALVLVVANTAIWQKEGLIVDGATVYVKLAPVDPRSLMQGDYMRLNFALPGNPPAVPGTMAQVVARLDAHKVAEILRFHDGGPLRPGEFLMTVVVKNQRWILATDAWYFKEGEAARWSGAAYGEFRVDRDGSAVLVGLRGPGLETL